MSHVKGMERTLSAEEREEKREEREKRRGKLKEPKAHVP
jgi:hypothetical protein